MKDGREQGTPQDDARYNRMGRESASYSDDVGSMGSRPKSVKFMGSRLVRVDAQFNDVITSQPFFIFVQITNNGNAVGSYVFDEQDTDVIEINNWEGTVTIHTAVRTIIPNADNPNISIFVDFVYKGSL